MHPEIEKLMSEEQLSNIVVKLLGLYGFKYYYTWQPRQSSNRATQVKDFPDIVAMKVPRLLVMELKREKGVVAPGQQEWIDGIKLCGSPESYVVRPSTLDLMQEIIENR